MPLLNNTVKKRLQPGKVKFELNSFKEYENEKGGYVKIEMKLPDRVNEHVIFPTGLGYFMSCMRRQLALDETVDWSYEEILERAQASNDLWVVISYDEKYGLNYAFHEPITKENALEVGFDEE